jgi:hypothetical protein
LGLLGGPKSATLGRARRRSRSAPRASTRTGPRRRGPT